MKVDAWTCHGTNNLKRTTIYIVRMQTSTKTGQNDY